MRLSCAGARQFVVAALCAAAGVLGADAAVRLDKPLVQKLDWGTRSMCSADINGDGLMDVLLINNDRARIELLLQNPEGKAPKRVQRVVRQNRWEPVLEDAPFTRESVVSADTLYALAAADLDADGLVDLVYTGKAHALSVRYQLSEGGFSEPEHHDGFEAVAWTSALKLADINGDSVPEILVLGKGALRIFYGQAGVRSLDEVKTFSLVGDVPYGLEVRDVNADNRPDVLYLYSGGRGTVELRLQDESGGFASAFAFEADLGPDLVQVLDAGEPQPFVYIQGKTGLLQEAHFEQVVQMMESPKHLLPEIYTASEDSIKDTAYAWGDFNADGTPDIVSADAGKPELRLFLGKGAGRFAAPTAYPALARVESLSAGRLAGHEKDTLVLLSPREKILATTCFEDGRFHFPTTLRLEGEPQAMAFGDLFTDHAGEEIVVISTVKKDFLVEIYAINERTNSWVRLLRQPLSDVKRAPYALSIIDLAGAHPVLVMHVRREAARLYRLSDKLPPDAEPTLSGWLVELAGNSGVRTLLDDLSPEQLGRGDVDGDGREELLVADTGYVRALGVRDNGVLYNVDQYNARAGEDEPRVPALMDIDQDGSVEVVFYDKSHAGFQVLERDGDGVFRYDRVLKAGAIDPVSLVHDEQGMWVFGAQRFWSLSRQGSLWEWDSRTIYETDIEDMHYTLFVVGNLNESPAQELVMVDGNKHILEVLERDEDGEYSSVLHFVVFDQNIHYRGRSGSSREPREVLVGDWTGDGRSDVLLLVHDRVLVYPGLP